MSYLFQETKQDISAHGSFVSFVQHDDGILRHVTINETLPQQHTVCHVLDLRLRTGAVLKPNGVPDLETKEDGQINVRTATSEV